MFFSPTALAAAPDAAPDAKTARAETLFHSGKREEAVKLLESVQSAQTYASRRAHLALGEFRIAMGHRADAEAPLMEIISDYNSDGINSKDTAGLALVGRAATLLRSPKDANKSFNEAERGDKKNVEARLWHAALFLDTYDPGHAEEVTNEALVAEPKNARAMLMLARIKLEQTLDFDAAEKLCAEALAIEPNLPGAYAVRAGIALRDGELANAETSIKKGLSLDPNDLELLSLRAAERFLDDDKPGFETAKKEVFAKNAEFARFYEIVADYAEWEHRYDDIVAMMKEATKLDPDDGKAWAELGLNESRNGDEPAGIDALKKAWSKDHFNIRVYNTLNLYEQAIANDYDTTTDGVLHVRYPKDEEPVLSRYVPKMLGEAWGSMKARYDFLPQTPVSIELYSNREQFSVRTSGLPNIGIQGVCFGRVVAAMSPKSEPFNWGNVVWHELGHVFAIQLSKSHVPRWFTEGLSEYETTARRPEWRRDLDPQLYLALKRGSLPHALDMNRAFTHATDAEDITVAYYAASQMMVFTVETYGMNKVSQALKLWGQGVKTPDVISRAFGVSGADYDAAFRAWALGRMKRYDTQFVFDDRGSSLDDAKKALVAAPNDANAHAGLALALLHAKKAEDAKKELDAALAADPKNANANFLMAKLVKDPDKSLGYLNTLKQNGHDGFAVEMGMAEIAEQKKDAKAQRVALENAYRYDPSQPDSLRDLVDLAKQEKRGADELDLLKKLAVIDPHNRPVWRSLIQKLVDAKSWEEARAFGESAMFVDVENAGTHVAYAQALAALGNHAQAKFELESALACNPKDDVALTIKAMMATEDAALKNAKKP